MNTLVQAWPRYKTLRARAFSWRRDLPVAKKVALAFGMAAVTGVAAQLRVPLAFTPVPVTGQVFAVLLAGVLLGRYYGGLSQVLYVGLGAAGVPWFTGLTSGGAALVGMTGGYLVGFVVAAELIGFVTDAYPAARSLGGQLAVMMLGVAVIYTAGALQLSLVLHTSLKATLAYAVVPFIALDAAKAVLAASVASTLLPKRGDAPSGGPGPRAK